MENEADKLCTLYILELQAQLEKWRDYLASISSDFISNEAESDKIAVQGVVSKEILNEIKESVKVSLSFSHFNEKKVRAANLKEVLKIEKNIEKIKNECVFVLEKNAEILRSEMIKIRGQLDSFSNPFRSLSSVYSKSEDGGEIVEIEA